MPQNQNPQPKGVGENGGPKKRKLNNFEWAYKAKTGEIKASELPNAAARQLYHQLSKDALESYLPRKVEVFDPYQKEKQPTNLRPKYHYLK